MKKVWLFVTILWLLLLCSCANGGYSKEEQKIIDSYDAEIQSEKTECEADVARLNMFLEILEKNGSLGRKQMESLSEETDVEIELLKYFSAQELKDFIQVRMDAREQVSDEIIKMLEEMKQKALNNLKDSTGEGVLAAPSEEKAEVFDYSDKYTGKYVAEYENIKLEIIGKNKEEYFLTYYANGRALSNIPVAYVENSDYRTNMMFYLDDCYPQNSGYVCVSFCNEDGAFPYNYSSLIEGIDDTNEYYSPLKKWNEADEGAFET